MHLCIFCALAIDFENILLCETTVLHNYLNQTKELNWCDLPQGSSHLISVN